MLSLHVK